MSEKNKEYYENFKNKHISEIKTKIICELCKGKYTYFNKSHHEKSRKHEYVILKKELDKLKVQHLNN